MLCHLAVRGDALPHESSIRDLPRSETRHETDTLRKDRRSAIEATKQHVVLPLLSSFSYPSLSLCLSSFLPPSFSQRMCISHNFRKIQFAFPGENDQTSFVSFHFFTSIREKSRSARSKLETASSAGRLPVAANIPCVICRQIADQSRFPCNRESVDQPDEIEFRWNRNCSSFPTRSIATSPVRREYAYYREHFVCSYTHRASTPRGNRSVELLKQKSRAVPTKRR